MVLHRSEENGCVGYMPFLSGMMLVFGEGPRRRMAKSTIISVLFLPISFLDQKTGWGSVRVRIRRNGELRLGLEIAGRKATPEVDHLPQSFAVLFHVVVEPTVELIES